MPRTTVARALRARATRRRGLTTAVFTVVALGCGEKKPLFTGDGKDGGPAGGGASGVGGSAGSSAVGGTSDGAAGEGGAGSDGKGGGGTGAIGGTPVDLAPYFGAGTRLQPIVHSAGGVDRFTGQWLDTELGVPCEFRGTSSDWRCLPTGPGMILGYSLDASCSMPLAMFPTSACLDGAEPLVALGPTQEACHGNDPYRIVGPAIVEPSAVYFGTPENCMSVPPESLPTGFAYYPAEPIEWSSLVGAEFVVRDRTPNLAAYVLESEDGAWSIAGFHNPSRDEPCWPSELGGLTRDNRCVPATISASESLFLDSNCQSQGALGTASSACSPHSPGAALRVGDGSETCPATTPYELLALGEPVAGSGYVRNPEGVCMSSNLQGTTLYALGEVISLESLPLLERGIVDAGRLRLAFHSFAGVPFLPEGHFIDAETAAPCRATLFSDEVLRCVPGDWLGVNADSTGMTSALFTDADCQSDRAFHFRADPCRPDAAPAGILLRDDGCGERFSEARVAVPFAGTVYGAQTGGPCEPIDSTEQGIVIYVPGAPLDLDEHFPPLEYAVRDQ